MNRGNFTNRTKPRDGLLRRTALNVSAVTVDTLGRVPLVAANHLAVNDIGKAPTEKPDRDVDEDHVLDRTQSD